jgi:hypothetical protein
LISTCKQVRGAAEGEAEGDELTLVDGDTDAEGLLLIEVLGELDMEVEGELETLVLADELTDDDTDVEGETELLTELDTDVEGE